MTCGRTGGDKGASMFDAYLQRPIEIRRLFVARAIAKNDEQENRGTVTGAYSGARRDGCRSFGYSAAPFGQVSGAVWKCCAIS
jgi:hypothetical protein